MNLKPYPGYQDSRADWLGQVPAHWTLGKVKTNFDIQLGKMLQTQAESRFDVELPYLRAYNVNWESIQTDDISTMWARPGELEQYGIRAGDLLVCEGGEAGRCAIVANLEGPTIIQNALHRIRGLGGNRERLLLYLLQVAAISGWLGVLCNKATIMHLTGDKLGNLSVAYPPEPEQDAIISFLDCETTKIDALIAEQRTLTERLREKRQALVLRATTKGLNPEIPFKASGVEWIEEVPDHWGVLRLKYVAQSVQTGATPDAASFAESGIDWYTPGDFRGNLHLERAQKFISEDQAVDRVFPKDSVLIVSIGATLGKVAFATRPCSANQQINAIVPNDLVSAKFLAYFLTTQEAVLRAQANASTLGIMNQERTRQILIPTPPRSEQTSITDYLDDRCGQIDLLLSEAETSIALLQEHRSALITAVVTGKVDVREAVKEPV